MDICQLCWARDQWRERHLVSVSDIWYLSTQPKEKERRQCYLGFMTPGASMASIHTPVPGFNPTIHDQVEITYLRKGPIRVYPPRWATISRLWRERMPSGGRTGSSPPSRVSRPLRLRLLERKQGRRLRGVGSPRMTKRRKRPHWRYTSVVF